MAHFYAFNHHYSDNIRDKRGHRIGSVVCFDTKRERDAYCYEEDAEPIPMKVARWYMLDTIRVWDPWQAVELAAIGSMDETIAAWEEALQLF